MMIVVNKKKLKKIIISMLVIILSIFFIVFMINKENSKQAFSLNQTNEPYYSGTKLQSGYVALTCNVDLGWENEYVELILKSLEREDVKITFNVTGRWAEKNPELLIKIKKNGHEVGNHGHKHLDYANLSYEENIKQIKTAKDIIEGILGEKTNFFQAPSGSFSDETVKAAKDLGYTCIKWDIDTIDWKNKEEPDVIIQRVKKKQIKDSSIVLMHPTNATSQSIDDIIRIIRENGLKPGRLSDVF